MHRLHITHIDGVTGTNTRAGVVHVNYYHTKDVSQNVALNNTVSQVVERFTVQVITELFPRWCRSDVQPTL